MGLVGAHREHIARLGSWPKAHRNPGGGAELADQDGHRRGELLAEPRPGPGQEIEQRVRVGPGPNVEGVAEVAGGDEVLLDGQYLAVGRRGVLRPRLGDLPYGWGDALGDVRVSVQYADGQEVRGLDGDGVEFLRRGRDDERSH